MTVDGPSRFKSRFSILSLLPPRHPPLQISDPVPVPPLPKLTRPLDTISHPRSSDDSHSHSHPRRPLPPTRNVDAARQATLVSWESVLSPAHSEYPDTTSRPSPPLLPPLVHPSSSSTVTPRRPARPDHRNQQEPYGDNAVSSEAEGPAPSEGSSSSSYTPSPPRRPPPLDLSKTKEAYPGVSGVIATAGTPALAPRPSRKESRRAGWLGLSRQGKRDIVSEKLGSPVRRKQKEKVPEKEEGDSFEACEVEPGHKYPEWNGRTSIKPGQILPRGTFVDLTPSLPSRDHSRDESSSYLRPPPTRQPTAYDNGETYDSVLHNVLLTPTYLGNSPTSSYPASTTRQERRKTLLNRVGDVVRDTSNKWVGKSILKRPTEDGADRVIREMREREMRDMARFRQATRPLPLHSQERLPLPPMQSQNQLQAHPQIIYISEGGGSGPRSHSHSHSHTSKTEYVYAKDSPGFIEWNVGTRRYKNQPQPREKGRADEKEYRSGVCCFRRKKKADKKKKLYKWAIVVAFVVLAALTIGLCTALLTQGGNSSSGHSYDSSTSDGTNPGSNTDSSQILQKCLNQFDSAADSPGSYPCSDCVPILTSATNDFTTPTGGGNSTGVGSALQFCALMDVYRSTNGNGLGDAGWAKDTSPCHWNGVTCDDRGRVTDLELRYPSVPSEISKTLANIVSLSSFRLMGNNSVPGGDFPQELLSLSNLTTLDLEYTGIRGDVSSLDFGKASKMTDLYLVNNANLGTKLPDLSRNDGLKTLAITGQKLSSVDEGRLPASLTYLDFSYNAFTGQIPSFSSLASLTTLYLSNNDFSSLPSSLPSSLASLKLTSNPSLSGSIPSSVCSSSTLVDCDMRSTGLERSSTGTGTSGQSTTSISGVSSVTSVGTSTGSSAGSLPSASGASCGVCKF